MKTDKVEFELIKPSLLPWQSHVIEQLIELHQQQKLPHALLIELRTAVDSREFGWYLVSALLCQSDDAPKPCGECQACRLLQANNYPDFTFTTLVENDKTHKLNKDIKIDQIRGVIHSLSLTNSLSGGKYALIYPAERMNQSSANALLKTLEEPSEGAVLIILTHNAGRLPVTIRSRCQKWVVENPDAETAREWLSGQGVPTEQINDYLELAQKDAQLADQLFHEEFKQQYDHFDELLQKYLNDQIDVVNMSSGLKSRQSDTLRLIIKTAVQKLIYKLLQNELTSTLKNQLSAMLNLLDQQQRQLSIEENNLNLQLQLEDVLISLKHIIK